VQRWPESWVVLGVMGAAGLPMAWRAARSVPKPAGGSMAVLNVNELRQMAPTFVGYGLFGAGYAGYMTFIIALLQKQGGSSEQMIWFWSVLGVVSGVSTLVWGRVLGAFHDGRGPALVFAVAMLGALAMLSIGSSLTRPPLFGLLSNLTSAHEQGATIGVAQSAGSLARILGPIYATALLHYMPALPYLTCTIVLLGTTIVVVQKLCTTDQTALVAGTNPAK